MFFIDLTEIQKYSENTGKMYLKTKKAKLIDFKNYDNFLILSNQKNKNLNLIIN